MGMYTELIFGAGIKKDIPEKDLIALCYLFDFEDEGWPKNPPEELPDHPFFKCSRWKSITTCSSYYFAVRNIHRNMVFDKISNTYQCSSRANLKNYDGEIEKFLDWVKPFIEQGSGDRDFYAIVCYEEQKEPTIYYLKEQDIENQAREMDRKLDQKSDALNM